MKVTTGVTREGLRVEVRHADHFRDDEVIIDGRSREVFHVNRFRDGGTTRYVCDGGTLTLPRRIGDDDRTPRWTPSPDATVEAR